MRVTNTSKILIDRIKLFILGPSGIGKTYLAKTIKEPTLVVSGEAGLLSISDANLDVIDLSIDDNGKEVPRTQRVKRLHDVSNFLKQDEIKAKYDWVFIDGFTEISQNMVETLKLQYPDKQDAFNLWGDYTEKMQVLIKTFRDLPDYNVVFTALETQTEDENGRRYMKVDIAGKKFPSRMPAMFDEYFWMHKDRKTGRRQLLTDTFENVIAKDRSGTLDLFEVPDLDIIAKKIRGPKKVRNTNATDNGSASGEVQGSSKGKVAATQRGGRATSVSDNTTADARNSGPSDSNGKHENKAS